MSSKFLGVVIVLILLLGYSCELQSITASPVGSISGKVTIVDYPIPVTGALVSISGRDNSTRVVDDNGQFFFYGLRSGEYSITVLTSDSYQPVSPMSLDVRSDQVTLVEFTVIPKGKITGVITEEGTNNVIREASIELGGDFQVLNKVSNNLGLFEFSNLVDGSYLLFVSHPDYLTSAMTISISNGSIVPVNIFLDKI